MHHYSEVLIKLLQKGTSAPVQKEKKKAWKWVLQRSEMVCDFPQHWQKQKNKQK